MKVKEIIHRRYRDLQPKEKRFFTLNWEKYELNECNKCEKIESTYELKWDIDFDLKGWTCLCEDCYFDVGGKPFEE